jgi:hypothetical protein
MKRTSLHPFPASISRVSSLFGPIPFAAKGVASNLISKGIETTTTTSHRAHLRIHRFLDLELDKHSLYQTAIKSTATQF